MREITINVYSETLAVGIYWYPTPTSIKCISGTIFHSWPPVLALIERVTLVYPASVVFIRSVEE